MIGRIVSLAAIALATTAIAMAKTPSESTHATVVALVNHRVNISPLVVGPMYQENVYILTRWDTGDAHGKGEALLKYTGSKWIVVRSAGGSLESASALQSLGVPASAARALVADFKQVQIPAF